MKALVFTRDPASIRVPEPGTRQYLWRWYERHPRCEHLRWERDTGCYRFLWPWRWRITNVGPYPSGGSEAGFIYRSWWLVGPLEVRTWGP